MKHLLLFLLCSTGCFAQKPAIDISVFDKWPAVENPSISSNGKYVTYIIKNQPVHGATLVIQATHTNWKTTFPSALPFEDKVITDDNQQVIFLKPGDSLGIFNLVDKSVEYIPHVQSFKLLPENLLAYTTVENELILPGKSFPDLKDYTFFGPQILLETKSGDSSALILIADSVKTIWKGIHLKNFILNENGAAFIAGDSLFYYGDSFFHYGDSHFYNRDSLFHYKDSLTLLTGNYAGLHPDMVSRFSKDGRKIFFTLREDEPLIDPDAVKVDVWSYTDARLQTEQLQELGPKSYTAVIHIRDHRVIRLEQPFERRAFNESSKDSVVCISKREGAYVESYWNPAARDSSYLVSTENGERRFLNITQAGLSPGGKYVFGFDTLHSNVYSYELTTGILRNITSNIPIPLIDSTVDLPNKKYRGFDIAGWIKNDEAIIIYDTYDIWKIDPKGKNTPVNITNGYGRKHTISFRLQGDFFYSGKTIDVNKKLILSTFNNTTKENGFYYITTGNPVLLSMGPFVYDIPQDMLLGGMTPIKSNNEQAYLVQRASATQSPNYFYTTDFSTFTPLSNIYPEKSYNWFTSTLLSWKNDNGNTLHGVLYKPEDFDPKKKYPVIIHYYERMSDNLNKYQTPDITDGLINIPWFVSQGYLVFTPDIYYKIGAAGESVCNTVVAAAKYLHTFSWVDNKIGIQGHSWGGYETNYIVTHTNLFTAAVSGAGFSDLISSYGSVMDQQGLSSQFFYEDYICRIGNTLWQRPDLYIRDSPVFYADKITTPLLLMHNKADALVPFAQSIELFTAMRRLHKKVWLLQYDNGDHHVYGKDGIDYTIRITQFFNHYLKGFPAPEWITKGIPAKSKGLTQKLTL
jgi:dienelactone hydrolase